MNKEDETLMIDVPPFFATVAQSAIGQLVAGQRPFAGLIEFNRGGEKVTVDILVTVAKS